MFDPAWKILNSSNVDIIKSFTTILDSELGRVDVYTYVCICDVIYVFRHSPQLCTHTNNRPPDLRTATISIRPPEGGGTAAK